MVVNATYATDVEWHCTGGAKCQETKITCPQNNYTQNGPWGTPCMCCLCFVFAVSFVCFY